MARLAAACNKWTTGLLMVALAVSADAAGAGPHSGVVAPRAPEVMIYFSHAIGGGVGGGSSFMRARPTMGLRLQQVRLGANSGDPEARGDAMQHRELLSWQMDARSDFHVSNMQLKLGRRVTYDLSNRHWGAPNQAAVRLPDVAAIHSQAAALRPSATAPFRALPANRVAQIGTPGDPILQQFHVAKLRVGGATPHRPCCHQ